MITLISSGEACPTFGHANATFLDQIVGLTCYCLLVIEGGLIVGAVVFLQTAHFFSYSASGKSANPPPKPVSEIF